MVIMRGFSECFTTLDKYFLLIFFSVKPSDRGKKDGLENLRREIAILKKVDHPNIVKLYEVEW